ncbi:ACT domain-containing protein [Halorubrum sp. RMP-47]|uniref:ACT domain-containing protein n=1 Tax=Halorubrum miltondacostae TaxID=3076378 RepID=A0ABD5M1A5_9EURY
MDPAEFIEGGTVSVSDETYAVCRTDGDHPDAFATVREANETTVVIEEERVDAVEADAVEHGWKRLTFEMELPFELVGFLAAVATVLAEVDVSVFVVSSYATDHVFVKRDDRADAVRKLEALGCEVDG